jgi:hypothetical protein
MPTGQHGSEVTMKKLALDDDQATLLREMLESCLSDLRMEIADTDSMDFRERLKIRKAVLQTVIEQLT